MPVRIYFRGLILFRFPKPGEPDAGKLVADLITEPPIRPKGLKIPPGQDDHEAEIQVIMGNDVQELLPHGLQRGARVEINIPGCTGGIQQAQSFTDHVPRISVLAGQAKLPGGNKLIDDYLRATIVVNCGTIRVSDVMIWDNGFPLPGIPGKPGDFPPAPAAVKFCGARMSGHAADECVLEVGGTDIVEIDSPAYPKLSRLYRSARFRNQLAQENTTEIVIRNYEYQRSKPVPWGLDFQWLFARLGYGTANLTAEVDNQFAAMGAQYDPVLLADDRASMLPGRVGRPFPYIVPDAQLTGLTPLSNNQPPPLGAKKKTRRRGVKGRSPLTGTKSRPLCIQGTSP